MTTIGTFAALLVVSCACFAASPTAQADKQASQLSAYQSRIDSECSDLLKLENGAVLEITDIAYLGYLGYRKKVILYGKGDVWHIWIAGKRTYECDLLRVPKDDDGDPVEALSILGVSEKGTVLKATDGRAFEVDSFDAFHTTMWLAPFDALLINEHELLNLERDDEPVGVVRLK